MLAKALRRQPSNVLCLKPLQRVRCLIGQATTVNDEEIAKFGKIGRAWWDETSHDGVGPLHAMNPVRVSFIRDEMAEKLGRQLLFATEQIKGLDIVDVGCGGGLLSESLARLGANVTGVDPSPQNVEVAKWHSQLDSKTSSINYLNTTVEELAQSETKFDVVCSLEVLEHVEDVNGFINACLRCLKPNGSLFLSTINRTPKSFAVAIAGAEYVTRIVPVGTHDWKKFITPEELRRMVESSEADCRAQVVAMKGMVLRPSLTCGGSVFKGLAKWELSDRDLDVNYIIHCLKL